MGDRTLLQVNALPTRAGSESPEEKRVAAARVIAARVTDPDERALLLDVLELPTPLVAFWDRTVIHPGSTGEDTVVCCLTDDGHPLALFLDDEHREALGALLIDPEPTS